MKNRDYQDYAINSTIDYFKQGKAGNPVIAMPTGTGKSVVIGGFVSYACQTYLNQKVMVITHVQELIQQNFNKLKLIWPEAPAGIYSAGLGRKEIMPITYAGIQSVAKIPHQFGHVDLVFVDEAHLIPVKATSMYRKFLDFLKKVNPNLRIIGLTATPYRVGSGMITDEKGFFDEICCDMTSLEAFNWFFDQGYLAPLYPCRTDLQIDLSEVGTQAGDFKNKDLDHATNKEQITRGAIKETIAAAEAENCNHWLIFGTGVDHVNNIVTELQAQGVSAVGVHSKMSNDERTANIKAFMDGDVTALVNNGILTTGFDAPQVDLIVVLRATKSPGLWVQILGRGTRPFYADGYDLSTQQGRLDAIANSPKPGCIILDFAGNTKRCGPINDPRIPERKKKGKGAAPVRDCDACPNQFHASLIVCPKCGHEHPPEIKFEAKSSKDELIVKKRKKKDDTPQVAVFAVDMVTYTLQIGKHGKPNYIEVGYQCGMKRYKQPLCLEHEGFAGKASRDWWRKAVGDTDTKVPETCEEALEMWSSCVRTAKFIRVWTNKKPYAEIKFVDYEGDLAEEAEKPLVDINTLRYAK